VAGSGQPPSGAKAAVAGKAAGLLFKGAVKHLPLRVEYPDGSILGTCGPDAPVMTMVRPGAFEARIGDSGLIGLGESFMAGDWDEGVNGSGEHLQDTCPGHRLPSGATVYSVTLSSEQQALAQERIAAAGYVDMVTVGLQDYRAVEGEYDAVVSVEIIEAVGYEYWPIYFQTIDRVLAPGGKVAIQAITMPHGRMLATRSAYTWVHKYIFPGGFLPSVRAIEGVTQQHTTLRVRERMGMGDHYAATLRLWEERFLEMSRDVAELGFDAVFQRMWLFYLCYSRAGFQSGYLDVQQIVLDRREAQL
jgi:hypothetical protein